jgi:hypothetical protein
MARKIAFLSDWNVVHPILDLGRFELWARYPAEIAQDLIVTPMLFGTIYEGAERGDVYTQPPCDFVLLHARDEAHLGALLDDVAPRLGALPDAYVLDANTGVVYDASRPGARLDLDAVVSGLAAVMRRRGVSGFGDVSVANAFVRSQRAVFEGLATGTQVETFRALPETGVRIAEVAAQAEANPLRLWEAMFWRGENYRWDLLRGECPLVGELWSDLAANRTLLRCVADAEHAFGVGADESRGWITCGPLRLRQRGSRVEIWFRMSPADRRAAFLPQTEVPGEDAMPSLLATLCAGGMNGKTEMLDGYTESVILAHPRLHAADVAGHLAEEIRRVVGAEVHLDAPDAEGGVAEHPEEPADAWRVRWWKRYVSVLTPMHRADSLPWEIHTGLHLAEDFMLWKMRQRSPGLTQGLAPLLRLIERRLIRGLTDNERAGVRAKLDAVGAERLGDVVLDLAPDALAAWIVDPDAR